jgi:Tfp pilus assembly PilM family ATPase
MAKILKMKKPDILGKLTGPPKKHLAIDIGNHTIKILELRTTAKGVDLVHHAVASTPPGGFQVSVLVAQLKEMLQEHRIKTKQAVIGLAGKGIATRRLTLTNIPEEEIPWEMRCWPSRYLRGMTAVLRRSRKYWRPLPPGRR